MTETATFAIALDDQTSGAAKSAAGALQDLKKKIEGDIGALAEMQAAMRRMKGGASMNVEAYKNLKAAIAAKHATIAKAQEQYVLLGGTFGKTGDAAAAAGDQMGALSNLIAQANPALGSAISKAGGLGKMLGSVGLAGAALAAAAAILALGTALAVLGLKIADTVRQQRVQMMGIASLAKAYRSLTPEMAMMGGGMYALIAGKAGAASMEAGDALTAMVGRVTDQFAVGREQVVGYMQSLVKARVSGKNLEAALEGAATMASVFGEEAAGQFITMSTQAQFFGGSVKRIANNVQAKFGEAARSLKLGLGAQLAQLKTDFGRLFTGLKIEKFLNGLHEMLSLFSQSTASGRALKAMVELMLQPLYDNAFALGPILKNLWRGMIIGVLMVTVAVLKIRNAFRDAFGKDTISNIDWANVALYAGATMGIALAGALALVAVAAAAFITPFVIAGKTTMWFVDQFRWAYNFLTTEANGWSTLGSLFVDGLILGIKTAATKAFDAVKNLGQGLKNAFTSVMQIQSPSRVFFGYGVNIGQGAIQGMEHVQPQVNEAAASMAPGLPMPQAQSFVATTNNSSQRGPTTINITVDGAGGDAKSIAKQVWEIVQDHLEGEIITIGGEALAT